MSEIGEEKYLPQIQNLSLRKAQSTSSRYAQIYPFLGRQKLPNITGSANNLRQPSNNTNSSCVVKTPGSYGTVMNYQIHKISSPTDRLSNVLIYFILPFKQRNT